jgi:hypothetical protein
MVVMLFIANLTNFLTDSDEPQNFQSSRILSSESTSIFGSVSSLNAFVGTMGLCVIIFAVLFVGYLFQVLRECTHDTPFEEMVSTMENELMIVGFTAFIFKILVNKTSFLNSSWYHAIEFADLLIPISSFTYCAIGAAVITSSVKQCLVWSKSYHMKVIELLDEFFDKSERLSYR